MLTSFFATHAHLNDIINKLQKQGVDVGKTKSRHDVWRSIVQRRSTLTVVPSNRK